MYADSPKAIKALERYLEDAQRERAHDLLQDIIKDIPGVRICSLPKPRRSFTSCLSKKKRKHLHKQHQTIQ